MPELPEVETIRSGLEQTLVARRLGPVTWADPGILGGVLRQELEEQVPGKTVENVDRRGKHLVVRLCGDLYLTVHLGMTGGLRVLPGETPMDHERLTILLGPGFREDVGEGKVERLAFIDMRKFGRVRMSAGAPWSGLEQLGADAWRGEWTAEWLGERLRSRRAPVKAILLQQRILAGIGNIYADEILFAAGVDPRRVARSLRDEEIRSVAHSIRRRLEDGVRLRGCSISDYADASGRPGAFQDDLLVYGRHGQECVLCGSVLQRAMVAGRGTTFCPSCQR